MMNKRLLETKFHFPSWRDGGVARSRLLACVQSGLAARHKLTLISAPAGYGKTTLVAEWIHALGGSIPIAWLSLEEGDNDPLRFLGYWLAALQRVNALPEHSAQTLLDQPQPPPVQAILDQLINQLAGGEGQVVLVLDDYHTITNATIHEALEYFIEHQPERMHLVITTRGDPPLPLARMRARGQMTEIRAGDLRFTADESRLFFSRAMQISLAEETLRALDERTEGWAAGLQLAALALQHQSDPAAFVAGFRGSHRYVLDYLAEEVIRQQDDVLRQFLAQTSVLERFNAEVCEALTGRADSAALLQRLEQANLFIIPLDDGREWYRYHHLFGEYLRNGLTKSEAAALNCQAARWHEDNGLVFEAVRYARASGETEFVADMVERAISREATWSDGLVSTLAGWLEALPPAALAARPLLSLHASRIAYLSGRFEQSEMLLQQAETALAGQPSAPETERLRSLAALYRGSVATVRGDIDSAGQHLRRALAGLPPGDYLARARAGFSLAMMQELSGAQASVAAAYLDVGRLAETAGVLFLAVNARCAAALVQITLGNLAEATKICHDTLALAQGKRLAPMGLAWSILSAVAYEQDDLLTAEKLLQDGLELSRQDGLQEDLYIGLLLQARLRVALGDLPGTQQAFEHLRTQAERFRLERLVQMGAAHRARLCLALGQVDLALQWAHDYRQLRLAQPVQYLREMEDLTLARILLLEGELQAAAEILGPLLQLAQAGGRVKICLEALLLQAQMHCRRQDTPVAIAALSAALRLGAPAGFVRIFLDEGPVVMQLLPRARSAAPQLVDRLLGTRPPAETSPLDALLDPLSEQELRVLKLILAGSSNAEIAAELVISVGTAKWHVHNVLQKLGVSNRSQAMLRARELGL